MKEMERILGTRKARALPMSLLATASAIAVAVMMVSTAWGAPVPKAAGSATIDRGGGVTFTVDLIAFDADETTTRADSGMFTYADANGYYVLRVMSTNVVRDTAVFAGPITESTLQGVYGAAFAVGEWIVVWVLDNGEPSSRGDALAGATASQSAALDQVNSWNGLTNPGWLPVVAGNIQVLPTWVPQPPAGG